MKTIMYDPVPEKKQDDSSEEEDASGDDSDVQSSNDENDEDIDNGYWGPGKDTEKVGKYYEFRRTDVSMLWWVWLEYLKDPENYEIKL